MRDRTGSWSRSSSAVPSAEEVRAVCCREVRGGVAGSCGVGSAGVESQVRSTSCWWG